MAIPATLNDIEIKVRRLTRSPSTQQLSEIDLDNYINTFLVYDFPEHLRTYNYRQQFSFTCNPYQDVYRTDIAAFGAATDAQENPLYNFHNLYLTVHPPVYVAGFQCLWTQSREELFNIYPKLNSISLNGPLVGDGLTTTFSGQINTNQAVLSNTLQQQICIAKQSVLFSSIDVNNNGLALVDVPIIDSTTGNPTVWGNLYIPQRAAGEDPSNQTPTVGQLMATAPYPLVNNGIPNLNNYINYVTGKFTITFPIAPGVGQLINSQVLMLTTARPQSVLWYANQFTLRPCPDQPYTVNFEVYRRPTQLLSEGAVPELEEYWQFIAYGAARKILQDRLDVESLAMIEEEYQKQLNLVHRRTCVQLANQRIATIYTQQTNSGGAWGSGWGSGSSGGF